MNDHPYALFLIRLLACRSDDDAHGSIVKGISNCLKELLWSFKNL